MRAFIITILIFSSLASGETRFCGGESIGIVKQNNEPFYTRTTCLDEQGENVAFSLSGSPSLDIVIAGDILSEPQPHIVWWITDPSIADPDGIVPLDEMTSEDVAWLVVLILLGGTVVIGVGSLVRFF